jgi:hypothetical protein
MPSPMQSQPAQCNDKFNSPVDLSMFEAPPMESGVGAGPEGDDESDDDDDFNIFGSSPPMVAGVGAAGGGPPGDGPSPFASFGPAFGGSGDSRPLSPLSPDVWEDPLSPTPLSPGGSASLPPAPPGVAGTAASGADGSGGGAAQGLPDRSLYNPRRQFVVTLYRAQHGLGLVLDHRGAPPNHHVWVDAVLPGPAMEAGNVHRGTLLVTANGLEVLLTGMEELLEQLRQPKLVLVLQVRSCAVVCGRWVYARVGLCARPAVARRRYTTCTSPSRHATPRHVTSRRAHAV